MAESARNHTTDDNASKYNVDEAEIQKFDRIAARWWDLEGEFKPLHDMNPVRTNYIDAASSVAEKQMLDVGCGGGILTEALAQRGAFASGIDMGEGPLEVARLHALESGLSINYHQATAEAFAAEHAEQFDIVACMEMLEHVPDPASVVQACATLVKPGGHVYFSTINRNPKAYALTILGAEYIAKLLPKGTHEYKKFIRPSELSHWVRQSGLIVEDLSGTRYNPFLKSFELAENDVSVNYMLRAVKSR